MGESEQFEGDGTRLEKFRQAVWTEFGYNLEKATPANVREFLDKNQEQIFEHRQANRFVIDEPKTTYEEILKDFFVRVLARPTDEALILLWTLAFELSFFNIEQHAAERLQSLFGEPGDARERD